MSAGTYLHRQNNLELKWSISMKCLHLKLNHKHMGVKVTTLHTKQCKEVENLNKPDGELDRKEKQALLIQVFCSISTIEDRMRNTEIMLQTVTFYHLVNQSHIFNDKC